MSTKRPQRLILSTLGLSALSLSAASCGSSSPAGPATEEVLENYAALLYAGYDDAVTDATTLRTALAPLYTDAEPTEAQLEAARETWVTSRRQYMLTEWARFVDGPIDGPDLNNPEIRINAWPLDEATIDYVRADASSEPMSVGIINTPEEELNTALLLTQNMNPGEENVTIGYHAIEFLLWGQDFSTTGPGDRPVSDFVVGAGDNADRRRTYLDITSQLLIDELTPVRDAWDPTSTDNFRAEFLSMDPNAALTLVLTAWGNFTVGEMAGQRLNEAIVTRDQEDEHSCFSDTTLLDHTDDIVSMRNLYLGTFTRRDGTVVSGASIADLVAARDPELDTRMRGHLDAAVAAVQALDETPGCAEASLEGQCPFDQLLRNDAGRNAIMGVVSAVRAVGVDISEIATLLGISITIEE